MAKSMIQKMNIAAGIEEEETEMPYKKGESIPGKGGVARPWTGPKPWRKVNGKGDHSTAKPL